MSLLEQAFEDYEFLDKKRTSDGMGGYSTQWTVGATIGCAVSFNNSLEARKAQKEGVSSVYTLITKRDITLEYHDVLRRVRDKKIFRITSDGDDDYTPPSAGLDMRAVSCEEWQIPPGEELVEAEDD